MTAKQILQDIKHGTALIYFGANIALFRQVLEKVYSNSDAILWELDGLDRNGLELVLRTCKGRFSGWNCNDSINFYSINPEKGFCGTAWAEKFINASKTGAKIL